VVGHVAKLFDIRPAGLYAIHPVFIEGRVAFTGEDELAVILLDGLFEDLLGLVTCSSHDRVVVVERYHRQDDVTRQRIAGTDKRLGTAGTLEAVQPHDRCAWLGLERVGDFAGEFGPETQASGGKTTEFEEAPAGDTVTAHHLIEGLVGGHNNSPLMQHGCVWAGCLPADLFSGHVPVQHYPLRADPTAQHASSSPLRCGIDIVVDTYLAFSRMPVRRSG
jgi:hypothetical protein